MNVIDRLVESGAVAIVRAQDQRSGQFIADAIVDAGLTCIEVTLTNPGALEIIAALASRSGVCVGVGTVLDPADVTRARLAGAMFVVSPNTNPEVIAATKREGLISIPGIATPSDVAIALEAGADVLKLFPASSYGPGHLKALRDPFPGNLWCPTGGMSVATIPDWFAAGATMVGLGGPLIHGGMDAIAANVLAFTNAIRVAKEFKA
jgi:2-dehydro-3-deoxyphosphogluconate aldolase/(4S)-4-hydroxy-2-oxoglutarate aldolase